MAVAHDEHTDTEQFTILYEEAENGWIAARIQEVPAAISQGRTREEARANVIAAFRDLTHPPTPVERLAERLRHAREHAAERLASRISRAHAR
jgi:HicA toxin of bacterial toxin-antitoxin,